MQEFNAIMGLAVMKVIDQHIANRRRYAARLVERLGRLPGIRFQTIRPLAYVNYQNFALLVDAEGFGLGREELYEALAAENILPRRYFYPPVHWHTAYQAYRSAWLPVTEQVSSQVLCLPFYSEMSDDILDVLCTAIECIQAYAPRIRQKLHSLCELNPGLAVPAQWAWHD
jgi:dTDP-4-amino-4,6-dideoxygalactose transaminase